MIYRNRIPAQLSRLFFVLFSGLLLVGCTTAKSVNYLNDLSKALPDSLEKAQYEFNIPIQKNDQLWITVGGSNVADLPALNSGAGVPTNAGAALMQSPAALGYIVEADGTVKLPYLGKVPAEGLTRLQLELELTKRFERFTKDPVVNVRFMNGKVTVLGEVRTPGTFSMVSDRLTILEALGLAGDLNITGERRPVLVVREVQGKRTVGEVNLLSKDLFRSPYYYMRTNDVVYVPPVSARYLQRERLPQYITVASGAISLIVALVTLLRVNR